MDPFTLETTSDEAATDFADYIKGRTVLITGISPNSLGAVATKSIAKHQPKLLIFASRSLSNINKVADEIKSMVPDVAIRALEVDLGSQQSVRSAAKEVLSYPENIDVYIHNASIAGTKYATTPEGIESTFGINHVGHFLLTCLLLPKIIAAAPGSRIAIDGQAYNHIASYGQSKTGNNLFAVALADRLGDKGITAFSVHPGVVPDTNFGRDGDPADAPSTRGITFTTDSSGKRKAVTHKPDGTRLTTGGKFDLPIRTLPEGAAKLVRAAFDPSLASANGQYLCEGMLDADTPDFMKVAPYAADKEAAKRFWALSEQLVGQEFSV